MILVLTVQRTVLSYNPHQMFFCFPINLCESIPLMLNLFQRSNLKASWDQPPQIYRLFRGSYPEKAPCFTIQ